MAELSSTMMSARGAVVYDASQSLTATQTSQARANIGLVDQYFSQSTASSYTDLTTTIQTLINNATRPLVIHGLVHFSSKITIPIGASVWFTGTIRPLSNSFDIFNQAVHTELRIDMIDARTGNYNGVNLASWDRIGVIVDGSTHVGTLAENSFDISTPTSTKIYIKGSYNDANSAGWACKLYAPTTSSTSRVSGWKGEIKGFWVSGLDVEQQGTSLNRFINSNVALIDLDMPKFALRMTDGSTSKAATAGNKFYIQVQSRDVQKTDDILVNVASQYNHIDGVIWDYTGALSGNTAAINIQSGAIYTTGQVIVNNGPKYLTDNSTNNTNNLSCVANGSISIPKRTELTISTPATNGSENSVSTAFSGTFNGSVQALRVDVTGSTTMGQPTSGYLYSQGNTPNYGMVYYNSGYNNGTSTNTGRTGWCFNRYSIKHYGKGDAVAYNASLYIDANDGTKTNFLAQPAAVVINGDFSCNANYVYANMGEFLINDGGFDISGIGFVYNLNRTNATGGQGTVWFGTRVQSIGSAQPDAAYSASGDYKAVFDLSTTSLTGNKALMAFKQDQRFYGNATSSNGYYATSLGSDYFTRSSSGFWNFVYNNASCLQINDTQVTTIKPLAVTLDASYVPAANSTMGFQLTSNTNLKISVRGSDGTVRVANITLA